MALAIWAVPAAVIQWLGEPARQLGILLATGLLIPNPMAGWAVLVGIAMRHRVLRFKGKQASGPMEVLAAGFIGGDALYGFSTRSSRPCRAANRGSLYATTPDAVVDAGKELQSQSAQAILLDCIGFTERHREELRPLGLPVILSNAVAAKLLSELLGG